jgi:hypothetical protein
MTTPCPQPGPGYISHDTGGAPWCCVSGGMYTYRDPATDPMCFQVPGESIAIARPPVPPYRDLLPRIVADITQADGRPGFSIRVDSDGGRHACPDMWDAQGWAPDAYPECTPLIYRDSPVSPVVAPDPRFMGYTYVGVNSD